MGKTKLWLISEVFYPDIEIATGNIATEIAYKFSEDFDVHVICGPMGYEGVKSYLDSQVVDKFTFHRVNHFNYNKNNKIKRVFRILGISICMFIKGLKIKKEDKVFLISNPAFVIPFFSFLKYCKGFKYTILMHDVFPENLIPAGYIKKTSIIYKLLLYVFTKSRSLASCIIVLGRDMKDLIERSSFKSGRNIIVIPNWADIDNIFPVSNLKNPLLPESVSDKILIQFAGNHGVLQNLKEFIEIIKFVDNPDVHFVFAGNGSTKEELIKFTDINKLKNVTFLPSFPRADLNIYMNSCSIGLVCLSDKLVGVGVPSKAYNILAAGKPILYLGNELTEIFRFVKENEVGWAYQFAERSYIISFLNNLHLDNLPEINEKGFLGRRVVSESYNKQRILDELYKSMVSSK